MVGDFVHSAHVTHAFCGVLPAEEEDFAGIFLADHAGEVGRTEPAVKGGNIGVGLFEAGVFPTGDGEVADHVQAVPAAGCPTRNDTDHNLGHKANKALNLKDVQATGACRVDRIGGIAAGVLVAGTTTDALITPGTERPATVARRWAIAGEKDAPHIGGHSGMVENAIQLVDGVRAKGIADLWPIERNPDTADIACTVIGDVTQVEAGDSVPSVGIEDVRDVGETAHRDMLAASAV